MKKAQLISSIISCLFILITFFIISCGGGGGTSSSSPSVSPSSGESTVDSQIKDPTNWKIVQTVDK